MFAVSDLYRVLIALCTLHRDEFIKDRPEGLSQFTAHPITLDEDAGEERLIDRPPKVIRRLRIGPAHVAGKVKRSLCVLDDEFERRIERTHPGFGSRQSTADAILL